MLGKRERRAAVLGGLCALSMAAPMISPIVPPASANASAASYAERFVTHHVGTFNGHKVRYSAVVEPMVLDDTSGVPLVRFVSKAFIRDDVRQRDRRPVIFVWGGGPSAASTVLQMRLYGPRLSTIPALGEEKDFAPVLADNPDSVLDVADLVFVDPPETGFSRILQPGKKDWFYSVEGDTRIIADFIEAWLKSNNREASPRFIHGQSYGSVRAIKVAEHLAEKRAVDGIIITGNSAMVLEAERRNSILSYALSIPTMAVGAVAHQRVDRRGRTDGQIVDESYNWALAEYLPALARVQELTPARKADIALRLADYSGLPADYFLDHDLAISREDWRVSMGKMTGVTPDRSDVRRTAQLPPPDGPAFAGMMREELGVTWPMAEYRDNAPATEMWNFGPPDRFAGNDWAGLLLAHMRLNPNVRYLSINGYHDGISIIGSVRYLFSRTPLPRDRVWAREYPGGHSIYTTQASRKAVLADVRAFVTADALP